MHLVFIVPPQGLGENRVVIERKGIDTERHRDLYEPKQRLGQRHIFSAAFPGFKGNCDSFSIPSVMFNVLTYMQFKFAPYSCCTLLYSHRRVICSREISF